MKMKSTPNSNIALLFGCLLFANAGCAPTAVDDVTDSGVTPLADAGAKPLDGGAGIDSGIVNDSGQVRNDAGLLDAGENNNGFDDAGENGVLDAGRVENVDAGAIDAGVFVDAGPATLESCFAGLQSSVVANYAESNPTIGSHCDGTNHQNFENVERVVFLGDSVTAGTPPTNRNSFFRNLVAEGLVSRFALEAPSSSWNITNYFANGVGSEIFSGDFANCSEWGERVGDLPGDGNQLDRCFPVEERAKNTLIISSIGGNDLKGIADKATATPQVPDEDLWLRADQILDSLAATFSWIYDEGRLTGDVKVILTNVYEYTDGTGLLLSCPAASSAGFEGNPHDPELLMAILNYINEGYMRLATERSVDIVFMREQFCGYGFERDNPQSPCYRGAGATELFDFSCIHPNPTGHERIAEAILNVVDE